MARRRSDIVIGVILVIVLGIILWLAIGIYTSPGSGGVTYSGSGDVAVLRLEGMIAEPTDFIDRLERYSERKDVKAIVLRIESPGGVVAASQEIYAAVKRARESEKPVVTSMGSIAASGGYYVALGSDSILANPGTLTGSIGVLMDFPEITKLLNELGIEFHSVTSGTYKNAGAPYDDWDEQTREYFKSIVMDSYDQFVQVVAEERRLSPDSVRILADGRVFTGRQALGHGLIDGIGGLHEAVQLAARMAGIEGEPSVIKPHRREIRLWDLLFGDMEQLINRVPQTPMLEYRYP